MSDFFERKDYWVRFNAITSGIDLKSADEIVIDHRQTAFTTEHGRLLDYVNNPTNALLDDDARGKLGADIMKKVYDATNSFSVFVEAVLESGGIEGIGRIAEVYAQAVVDAEPLFGPVPADNDDAQQRLLDDTNRMLIFTFQQLDGDNKKVAAEIQRVYYELCEKISITAGLY